ncbi:MAG TPA: BTAD domain-containing putative transcriptional regulator [Fimbriimonadaceae bacterium]|nr:BTAD domain-containing putative transcriptional regulator [Fimbriimonadaceae bacterium]HRJ97378.1 BTAD domain-containing putative transcriptional regulator [Fimbriimonadaceae bacterium]
MSDSHDATMQVKLLGPFDVRLDGHPLPPVRSRKGLWLLAQLALRQGREVDRAWLAGTLWPESPDTQALASLRRTLTDVRAALGPFDAKVVTPTPKTLLLVESGVWVDVAEFDRLAASTDLGEVESALALYRGPLLEGCAEEWVLGDRQSREETFLQASELAARLAMERVEYSRAIGFLKRAIAVDPFRESATRNLMEACAANGDHAAAVVAFRQLRERLLYELNGDPSAETVALLERIRKDARIIAHRTSAPIEAPAAPRPVAAMPPPPEPASRGNVPEPLTEIVGREQDLQEIEAHLMSSRLVTLLGPGGIGKTRLSIELAHNLSSEFAGGAWFVDFTPLEDPDLVPQHVEHELQIHERPGFTASEDLVAALSGEPVLVVFDNCEHLIDACADLADRLLKSCADLRILATSREPLGLVGEVAWRVPSLSVPEPKRVRQLVDQFTAGLLQYDAVRLFMARAQAALPGFELTMDNATAIIDICRRLDGIALALELAAARLKALSVQEIAERLNDRFKLLTGGSRGAPTRQTTLRAALDWSYDLLSDPEKLMLRRVSIFGGPFTLAAAEQVTEGGGIGEGESLDLVSRLVDKSLVRAETGPDGKVRYSVLESTREFARELLIQSGEHDEIAGRHAAYYLDLARRARAQMYGPEEFEALEMLDRSFDNIRAALHWSTETRRGSIALTLVEMLRVFWSSRDRINEARTWIQRSLDCDDEKTVQRVGVLQVASHYATLSGDMERARQYVETGVLIAQEIGDKRALAEIMRNMAGVYSELQRHEEALDWVGQALELDRELGANEGILRSLTASGLVNLDAGQTHEAKRLFAEAIRLCESTGGESMKGWNCSNMGDALIAEGNPAEAVDWYREGLDRLVKYGGTMGTCEGVRGLCLAIGLTAQDARTRREAVAMIAAAGRHQGSMGLHLRRFDKEQRDRVMGETRTVMGDDAFDESWNEGTTIEFDVMVERTFALVGSLKGDLATAKT